MRTEQYPNDSTGRNKEMIGDNSMSVSILKMLAHHLRRHRKPYITAWVTLSFPVLHAVASLWVAVTIYALVIAIAGLLWD